MNASTSTNYDPCLIPSLAPVIKKATEVLNSSKTGSSELKKNIERVVSSTQSLESEFQVQKPDGGSALRCFTFAELAESSKHEVTAQAVDPSAVNDILFGRYGLIRKSGGGREKRLMEDIEVAYIHDLRAGSVAGPIITSGRHRTLALQIMLKAAGFNGYQSVKVRCSVINCSLQEEVQARIISANTGSRDFSRAEIRERVGSTSGVELFSCESIQDSILHAGNAKDFKAAFSCYVKLLAADLDLNHFTPAQYSDAGNSLWNQLEKARPEGGTFLKWIKADKPGRFEKVMSSVKAALPLAVVTAQHDPQNGSKAGKVARALSPTVIERCF